jgi:hypothetical protein
MHSGTFGLRLRSVTEYLKGSFLSLLSLFFLVKKSNQKRQAKNMLHPPLGILRISRSRWLREPQPPIETSGTEVLEVPRNGSHFWQAARHATKLFLIS